MMILVQMSILTLFFFVLGTVFGLVAAMVIYAMKPLVKAFLGGHTRYLEVASRVIAQEKMGKYVFYISEDDFPEMLRLYKKYKKGEL